MTLQCAHAIFILKHVVMGEGLFRLHVLLGSPLLCSFDVFFMIGRGFGNLMFLLWFTFLGGSFVVLDLGPSISMFLVFPFLGVLVNLIWLAWFHHL
jgi:hypothetical protein